ncbi:MAG TPA: carbohydrate ABC transporter permease [Candidatus Avipropionibacterium avicola]|uniref:Carbohydrate ABC transporter permease n=1 Tax=Candidatus Avipropionibacterium avicola TaxID=2840701 RepID=A0A9D1GVU0_9ACTN|nr:carbohydrate ABC transporter permease [Candidatus Avipropionibacterium avicola]
MTTRTVPTTAAVAPGPPPGPARVRRRGGVGTVVRHVLAVVVAVAFLAPLLWTVRVSLSTPADVYQFPPRLFGDWDFSHYPRAWQARPWLRYFGNTVFIAGCVVALTITTSLMAGFAFALMKFRGRGILFGLCMAVMMVPQTVLLIPNFVIAQTLNLYDTYLIQILPWAASVFGIFLMRQFFVTLPRELFEAAELDGAGTWRMLFLVAAPLARPPMVLVALNSFMGSWNSFVWPYLMTRRDEIRPIEVGLQTFYGAEGTDWNGLTAAITFTTIPVIVIFLFLQRYFVHGAYGVEGGVRG